MNDSETIAPAKDSGIKGPTNGLALAFEKELKQIFG
jgi:hypothetical protein